MERRNIDSDSDDSTRATPGYSTPINSSPEECADVTHISDEGSPTEEPIVTFSSSRSSKDSVIEGAKSDIVINLTDSPDNPQEYVPLSAVRNLFKMTSPSNFNKMFHIGDTKNNDLPEIEKPTKIQEPSPLIKCIRLYVEATCMLSPVSQQGEVINLMCEPLLESLSPPEPTGKSDGSSQFADVSRTISPLSRAPMTYIPPPATRLSHMSYASHTSGSSLASSAGALFLRNLVKNKLNVDGLSMERMDFLDKHWKGSNLIFRVLDCIDLIFHDMLSLPEKITKELITNGFNTVPGPSLEYTPTSTKKQSRRITTTPDKDEPACKKTKGFPVDDVPTQAAVDCNAGSYVFAKWQDSKYYAGKVADQIGDRWLIAFLDGNLRKVTEDQLIISDEFLVGQKVMAIKHSVGKYYPGVVINRKMTNNTVYYTVATDRGDLYVSANYVYLTENQAKHIKVAISSEINLSKLISSPRLTRSRARTNSPNPCSSGTQSKRRVEYEYDDSSDITSGTSSSDATIISVTGCDHELTSQQDYNTNVKLKNVSGKMPKTKNVIDDGIVGPLHSSGNWFKGLGFLLTCSGRQMFTDSIDDIATDSEDYPFTKIPFIHDRLEMQIKSNGGRVYSSFGDVPINHFKSTFLVSWRPCLTTRYVECLAVGIRMVCHEWIVNCCIKKKRLAFQELPAGWSIETKSFINMFDRKKAHPFKGLHIKIAFLNDKYFFDFWSRICSVAGAITSTFKGNHLNADLILVENYVRDPSLDIASSYGVPLVSTVWVVQSLIHGEIRQFEKHPSYHPLYDESEDL